MGRASSDPIAIVSIIGLVLVIPLAIFLLTCTARRSADATWQWVRRDARWQRLYRERAEADRIHEASARLHSVQRARPQRRAEASSKRKRPTKITAPTVRAQSLRPQQNGMLSQKMAGKERRHSGLRYVSFADPDTPSLHASSQHGDAKEMESTESQQPRTVTSPGPKNSKVTAPHGQPVAKAAIPTGLLSKPLPKLPPTTHQSLLDPEPGLMFDDVFDRWQQRRPQAPRLEVDVDDDLEAWRWTVDFRERLNSTAAFFSDHIEGMRRDMSGLGWSGL